MLQTVPHDVALSCSFLKCELCDATVERMIFRVAYFANAKVILTLFNEKILLVSYKFCDFPASL